MTQIIDQYVVVGNPIAHSKSPQIHTLFATQTKQHMQYQALLAPLDGFVATLDAFCAQGMHCRGANVTVPFKLEALCFATQLTARAMAAQAVNTLSFTADGVIGDNTDGVGLVTDISKRLQYNLANQRILMLGAGGAARGVIEPLREMNPASITIANRSLDNALSLGHIFDLPAYTFDQLKHVSTQFDLIINATASGLQQQSPQLPNECYQHCTLAYDMMYGAKPTVFMDIAKQSGAQRVADGLGMLVEQAAQAFYLWRGVLPETETVYQQLRAQITK